MNHKLLSSALLALALSACGGSAPNEQTASEEDAAMSASDYAAYSSASDTPPPDILPDDEPQEGINPQQASYQAEYQAAGRHINVVYDTSTNPPVARLIFDGEREIVLKQTDAWAKGAAYSNGSITWLDNGGSADLEQNGKTTTFKQVDTPAAASTASQ